MSLVAIAGNPNTGKTSVFNRLTGGNARVGNYPGVTVDRVSGTVRLEDRSVSLLDVPGAYSISARTAEEQIAIDALLGLQGQPAVDAVVVCVDASQLQRNLYLLLQLQELGLPLLVALTMVDELDDVAALPEQVSDALGCPVVAVNGRTGEGLSELGDALVSVLDAPAPEPAWRWMPSPRLATWMTVVAAELPDDWPRSDALALWLLSSIAPGDELVGVPEAVRGAIAELDVDGRAVDDEVIQARYGWIDQAVPGPPKESRVATRTARIDDVLVHPVTGFATFLVLMFAVFQALFSWSDPAISAVEEFVGVLGTGAAWALPDGLLEDFVVQGLIGGVGSVVVFLPQILLLFFFIGLMEDSGYMARVATLMDRVMRAMNLHGRAFVPMLSGFACAVPAVLATRTMERRRDRLLTMMVVPLMTCSARLPVYTLIIAALFPAATVLGVFPVQSLLMVALYVFSVVVSLAAAWVLSKTLLPAPPTPFLMELPPYRLPRLPDVLRMMWRRSKVFLTEAGTVILACTVVLWFLLSFPQVDPAALAPGPDGAVTSEQVAGAQLRESWGGQLGQAIEPAIAPLGFDWKIGVGLIGAFAAREVFVSTMGVVYNVGADVDEESLTLREQMRSEVRADGRHVYTPLTGLSLMVFFALAAQCMSTLAVVRRETAGWRWPAFLFVYMTALAWLASLLVYQGGRLLGFG